MLPPFIHTFLLYCFQNMIKQFKRWMKWYGKRYTKFMVSTKSFFLSKVLKDQLNNAWNKKESNVQFSKKSEVIGETVNIK